MTTDTRLTFDLAGEDGGDALHRVLAVCHARRCAVTAVRFDRGDRHRPPHLELGLTGEPEQIRRLVARLETLVGVRLRPRAAATPLRAARTAAGGRPRAAHATPGAR